MNKLILENYDLNMTLMGGQAFCFDYDEKENTYYGVTRDSVLKLKKENDVLYWQTYPKKNDLDFIKGYLRLDSDYNKILKKIKKDEHVKKAIKKYPNLRLLKQDFEETLLSFLVSSNNNIKSIRRIIREMNKRFGKKIKADGKEFYLFPETETIANAKLEDLLACKLGFRAKFIKGAANHLLKTNLHKKIIKMSEEKARSSLLEINGVGEKIADCVLVFSLSFDNTTPLDVWGKRFLVQFYKLNPKMKYTDMRKWIGDYFEGYSAWAGQFLFEYIRHLD
jgi:N-glycosylase/DNA lyase